MAVAVYKGFNTVDNKFGSSKLVDKDLIKRDILNHFAIRKGEKLMNGNFGTSIYDLIMDPLTEETKQIVLEEVTTVIQNDRRVRAENILLDEFENGLQVQVQVRYTTTNEVENLLIQFDRSDREA